MHDMAVCYGMMSLVVKETFLLHETLKKEQNKQNKTTPKKQQQNQNKPYPI